MKKEKKVNDCVHIGGSLSLSVGAERVNPATHGLLPKIFVRCLFQDNKRGQSEYLSQPHLPLTPLVLFFFPLFPLARFGRSFLLPDDFPTPLLTPRFSYCWQSFRLCRLFLFLFSFFFFGSQQLRAFFFRTSCAQSVARPLNPSHLASQKRPTAGGATHGARPAADRALSTRSHLDS